MTRFRKKPVVVDAWQFTDADTCNLPQWLGDPFGENNPVVFGADGETAYIYTLEGCMTARIGDWIIRGVSGELYPCKPDIFAKTYELVTE